MSGARGYATLVEAIDFIGNGRRAVHAGSCPEPSSQFPCAACPQFKPVAQVLDLIVAGNAAPSTCHPARLLLHDIRCLSGCEGTGRDEHARRHDGTVRELRRYVKAQQADHR